MIQIMQLCESISETVKDYREDELGSNFMNPEHVYKWASQFNQDSIKPILIEIDILLKNHYVSKIKMKEFLTLIFDIKGIFSDNVNSELDNITFLDIQRKGNSQHRLVNKLSNISKLRYKKDIKINNFDDINTSKYIYLDDALFSGNTMFYDIKNNLNKLKNNTELYIISYAIYTDGVNYNIGRIEELLKSKNIKITTGRMYTYKNSKNIMGSEEYQCFFPRNSYSSTSLNNYIEKLNHQRNTFPNAPNLPFFRNFVSKIDKDFTSEENRIIIEKEFLINGLKIIDSCKEPQQSMRPMGYEYLPTLGFGSFFIHHNNIANNCPLVLWWGETDESKITHFSKWYPLFPRRIN